MVIFNSYVKLPEGIWLVMDGSRGRRSDDFDGKLTPHFTSEKRHVCVLSNEPTFTLRLRKRRPTSYLKLWKWWFRWKCQVSSQHGSINCQTDVTLLPNKHVVWCAMSLILPDSIPWKTTSYQFNGNSRILKWWYVSAIFLAICGDIPWNLGLIYIYMPYLYGRYLQ